MFAGELINSSNSQSNLYPLWCILFCKSIFLNIFSCNQYRHAIFAEQKKSFTALRCYWSIEKMYQTLNQKDIQIVSKKSQEIQRRYWLNKKIYKSVIYWLQHQKSSWRYSYWSNDIFIKYTFNQKDCNIKKLAQDTTPNEKMYKEYIFYWCCNEIQNQKSKSR